MTRNEVYQIFYLEKEIKKLQERLKPEKADELMKPIVLDGQPRGKGGTGDPTGNIAASNAQLQKRIQKLLKRIQRKRQEIFDYIESIDDPLLRMIIIFRCVDLCSWNEVAANIGGPVTPDSARMMFNRHFKED